MRKRRRMTTAYWRSEHVQWLVWRPRYVAFAKEIARACEQIVRRAELMTNEEDGQS